MRKPREEPTREIRCQRCERPIEGIEFTLPGVVLPFDAVGRAGCSATSGTWRTWTGSTSRP